LSFPLLLNREDEFDQQKSDLKEKKAYNDNYFFLRVGNEITMPLGLTNSISLSSSLRSRYKRTIFKIKS